MKNIPYHILLTIGLLLMGFQPVGAQTNKEYILSQTNTAELRKAAVHLAAKYKKERAIAVRKAIENGWDTINLRRLNRFGDPIYDQPTNNDAAGISNTDDARIDLGTEGAGMVIGMWEAVELGTSTYPRESHQDFSDGNGGDRITRVNWGGAPNTPSSHATHVAGTLIGDPPSGTSDDSKGMAPQATMRAHSSFNDVSEMASDAANFNMLVSNHSYGPNDGWDFDDWQNSGFPLEDDYQRWTWTGGSGQFNANGDDPEFGRYDDRSRDIDSISYLAPFYLSVWAAGNDDNDNPEEAPDIFQVDDKVRNGTNGSYVDYDPSIHPKGDGDQICNVSGGGLATNVLTIGNMTKTGAISGSSSRGVGDDGRMFPLLCGTGTTVYSADSGSNTDYDNKDGTSMASPNVAGSLLLLQDGYEKLHGETGEYMRSATLKALAIHTALDITGGPGRYGPDYTFGWGRLDAGKAAEVINEDGWKTPTSRATIIEDVYTTVGTTLSYDFKFSGTEEMKVTLAYNDPVDPNSLTPLQNDLDLRVVRLSPLTTFEPFVLDPNNPTAQAGYGDNDIENVEQVRLVNSQEKVFSVRVTLEGSLYDGAPQPFSLIISGLDPSCHHTITHDRNIKLATGQYNASNWIESASTIDSGKDVTYQRSSSVTLKPGFHAKTGSRFETVKATCN